MDYQFTITGFSDEIDADIDKQFSFLNELGIGYFEVRGVNGKNISALNDEELKELKSKMQQYGIKVSAIGSPIGKIRITDDFEPHFNQFKRVCDIAKYLGTKTIRIFSFYYPEGEDPECYKDEVFARLQAMVTYAEEQDLLLLHENEKGIYGDVAVRCKEIFDHIQSPNFKAIFDPANFVQCGQQTYPQAFDLLCDKIVYMHIKDADENGNVVPVGYGIGNVKMILDTLKARGYRGFLSLEPHLGSFAGLDALETDDTMTKLDQSDSGKFRLAYESLIRLLGREN